MVCVFLFKPYHDWISTRIQPCSRSSRPISSHLCPRVFFRSLLPSVSLSLLSRGEWLGSLRTWPSSSRTSIHLVPSHAPCIGRVHRDLRARAGGRAEGWFCQVQEMLAGVCHGKNCACGCLLRARSSSSHPAPSGAVSGPLRSDFDQEGAEPQSVEDEDLNDAWLPASVIEKELEARPASARGSHEGTAGTESSTHRGTIVCISCGGYSMWVNWQAAS